MCLAGRDDDEARAAYLSRGDSEHQLLWLMDQNNDVLGAEVSLWFLCWPCPSYVNNLVMPHLISSGVKSQPKGVPGDVSGVCSFPGKDLQVSVVVPVCFTGCLLCLCFEVWVCNSDNDEPLKDLSRSRNWEHF